ncbi:MAG: hypothetical protein Q4P15_02160 [Propionibacteriaceae bacterium]|nr:hypothetical protein [Propionibacteriaceae bacterium]
MNRSIATAAPAPMGLLGTVFGILVLAVGLFRSRVVPRWVPAALWLFLLLEFVGSSISEWAVLVSGVFYVVALGGAAVTLWGGAYEGRIPVGDPLSRAPGADPASGFSPASRSRRAL